AVTGDPPAEALVSIRLVGVQWAGDQADDVEVDVTLADLDGAALARLSGVRFGVAQHAAVPEPAADRGAVAQVSAERLEPPAPAPHRYRASAVRRHLGPQRRARRPAPAP